jgi:hypothetical protein
VEECKPLPQVVREDRLFVDVRSEELDADVSDQGLRLVHFFSSTWAVSDTKYTLDIL